MATEPSPEQREARATALALVTIAGEQDGRAFLQLMDGVDARLVAATLAHMVWTILKVWAGATGEDPVAVWRRMCARINENWDEQG